MSRNEHKQLNLCYDAASLIDSQVSKNFSIKYNNQITKSMSVSKQLTPDTSRSDKMRDILK